jgi:hypothetical protein
MGVDNLLIASASPAAAPEAVARSAAALPGVSAAAALEAALSGTVVETPAPGCPGGRVGSLAGPETPGVPSRGARVGCGTNGTGKPMFDFSSDGF